MDYTLKKARGSGKKRQIQKIIYKNQKLSITFQLMILNFDF
jgi:hypothetical protein